MFNMGTMVHIIGEVCVGIGLALLIRRFVCMLILVKGSSMRNTLQNGDLCFALRRRRAGALRRFDIVICRYRGQRGLRIKRVVGLPGERIELREGRLVIDGEEIDEAFDLRPSRTNMDERVLGDKEIFLLGDNRPGSRDSRSVGAIHEEEILGVATHVLLPLRNRKRLRPKIRS